MKKKINVVYLSNTEKTVFFMNKLKYDKENVLRLTPETEGILFDEPYILIVPSYEPEAIVPVTNFLRNNDNYKNMIALVGTGNRNFAEHFCYSAKDISRHYKVPIVHMFEFAGFKEDVTKIREIIENYNETGSLRDSDIMDVELNYDNKFSIIPYDIRFPYIKR